MSAAEDLVSKARRFLRTARLALEDGDNDSAASRCYYAMFFLAEALLHAKGLRASSHKGVIMLFGEHFVKTGEVETAHGRNLRRAHELRQKGDYSTEYIITRGEAEEILEKAIAFSEEAERLLRREADTR